MCDHDTQYNGYAAARLYSIIYAWWWYELSYQSANHMANTYSFRNSRSLVVLKHLNDAGMFQSTTTLDEHLFIKMLTDDLQMLTSTRRNVSCDGIDS